MFIPTVLVTYLVLTATAALYCLIAIWSATSRGHWFFRAMAFPLALAALLPIQAHEPLIYVAMVMGEIVTLIFVGRWIARLWQARPPLVVKWPLRDAWRRRLSRLGEVLPTFRNLLASVLQNDNRQEIVQAPSSRWFRFGIRDLLLAMVPVGISAWIVSQFAGVGLLIRWPDAIYASLWLAVIGVLAWGIFASRWKWLLVFLLVVAVLRAAFVDAELLGDWLWAGEAIEVQKSLASFGFLSRTTILLRLLWLYAQTAVWILAGLAILAVARSAQRRSVWRILAAGVLLPPAALLAWVYWQMIGVAKIPVSPPLPENVYPEILALAARNEKASPSEAAAIHRELLGLLDRPARVEMNWSLAASDPASANDMTYVVQYRNLARSLQAEAENLHAAGKHDEAARYELAILELGAVHLRGGLVFHALIGIAVEGVGTSLLAKHRAEFSPPVARRIIAETATMDEGREPVAAILDRDRAFESVAWRWRTRLQWAVDRLLFGHREGQLTAPQRHVLYDAFKRQQVDEQLLLADLAIRLYQHNHGSWPSSLEELVPDYLPQLPTDLHSQGPLVYRRNSEGFLLYSVGPDHRDNGGRFGTRIESMGSGFDLDLDTVAK